MKYINYYLRFLLLMACGLAVNNYAMAQCTTPVITSITATNPVCDGGTLFLNATGTVGGVSSAYVRMAAIGGNSGNQEFNELFSSGDRPGAITRMTNATFDAIIAPAATATAKATLLKAQYDVLMFTWASPSDNNINWPLLEAYLNLGGSIFWDGDYANIAKLAAGGGPVGAQNEGSSSCNYVLVAPAPFPTLLANGINGCFVNHHLSVTSWPSWMQPYIKAQDNTTVVAIAGIYPGGNHGRLIIQGPDQDYHACRCSSSAPWGGGTAGNQYQIMLNQMDFLSANQSGFTWAGPNGFTSNSANPTISNVTAAAAGVYTATLTNISGGGCTAVATVNVTVTTPPSSFSVTGGGSICPGTTGVAIGLSGSQSGVDYQLRLVSTPSGSAVAGTGTAITFGLRNGAGTYFVDATSASTGCVTTMSGSAVISHFAIPNLYSMTGGGGYCPGGSGVTVGLSGSQTGITYQLMQGSTPIGSPVAGTGSAISFGLQTTAGGYTVVATTTANGCIRNMNGTATVVINPEPGTFTGTQTLCPGTTTTLSNTTSGGTWSSTNTSVATVGVSTGVVSGVAAGTSTISYTLTTSCGTATAVVTVSTPPSVAAITGNTSVFAGYTTTLSTATSGGIWSSSNTGVATVNSAGVVSGVATGTSIITYSVTGNCVTQVFATVNVLSCDGNGSLTFNYTGADQTWTVPDGVTSVTVTVTGAAGGTGYYNATYGNRAGWGGVVSAALAVTPGQVLNLYVGGKGDNNSGSSTPLAYGGYNGGGNASPGYGYYSGGGGGASDIRIGGSSLTDRVVVAGGGGGEGYGYPAGNTGGDGGNLTGGTGGVYSSSNTAATGGTQTSGGSAGTYVSGALYTGTAGSFGAGGTGSYYYGAGGGGGYYGGGGGGYVSSGGGGSSYAGGGTSSVSYTQGVNAGNGQIQISFPQSLLAITSNPSDVTSCSGTTASFSVSASLAPANPGLSYQWQVNTGSGFSNISGATGSTYSFTSATTDDGNEYRVIVSGVCSQSATSSSAALTVIGVPVISVCPSNVTVSNEAGNCSANVTYSAATVTGTSPTVTYSAASGSSFSVGTTAVTVDASNSCGSVTCSFDVTVNDDEAPTITAPSGITVNNDAGECGATVSIGSATTADNCEVASVTNDHASSTYPVGTTTVTWTVTDIHGNTNTATQTVTVVDAEAPTISVSNVTVNNDAGVCGAAVTLTATASDNCAGVGTPTNDWTGGNFPVGITTVTWTVTDAHSNTSTATQTITVNDNEAPVAVCQNYTLNLSGGTGTVSASNINNGSSDNCEIESMSVSPNTFTCADAGANTVTLTVTDIHGNSSTCTATVTVQYQPSCSISVTPSNSTYTGGNANTIYLGYGPQSATLTATATGGSGFSYSWTPGTGLSCTNCQSPVFAPTASGTYNYTVTVTNSNGCSTTCVVSLCVIDARDPDHANKVILCHVPPGNPSNPQTLSVSASAIPSHLNNHAGDRIGACSSSCGTAGKGTARAADMYDANGFSLLVYPNPFSNEINVDIEGQENIPADIVLYDMTGRVMQYLPNQSIGKSISVGKDLPAGMYILEVKQNESSKRVKVTKL